MNQIGKDLLMIIVKLMQDYNVLVAECITPFYITVNNYPGINLKTLEKENESLKEDYQAIRKLLEEKKFIIKTVWVTYKQFAGKAASMVRELHAQQMDLFNQQKARMNINDR